MRATGTAIQKDTGHRGAARVRCVSCDRVVLREEAHKRRTSAGAVFWCHWCHDVSTERPR
jgi:hypothetical protein